MFVTGPNVVKTVTHEEIDLEGLGGARVHNEVERRRAVPRADREAEALLLARQLLGYLPQNNVDPVAAARANGRRRPCRRRRRWMRSFRDSAQQSYDMHDVIAGIVDADSFLEVHAGFARNIICGLRAHRGSQLSASSPSSPTSWPASSTSMHPTRPRDSSGPATASTFRC